MNLEKRFSKSMADNFDLYEECSFTEWDEEVKSLLSPIDCGECDLNDFFANDAILYARQLLGKTYVWVTSHEPKRVVAAFTVSNDSIKSKLLTKATLNKINRPIDNHKRGRTYPAVLIGRFGVDKAFQGGQRHIGMQVMDFIKLWFTSKDNKTGCRFLLVDAYNSDAVLNFYKRCGFKFLYHTEIEEKDFYGIHKEETLRTRMMYFDLK